MTVSNSSTNPTLSRGLSISFLPQLEWSKKLARLSAKRSSDLLCFSAERLRAHAALLQDWADSEDVWDLFKRQSEFLQSSWVAYSTELPKAFGVLGKAGNEAPSEDVGSPR